MDNSLIKRQAAIDALKEHRALYCDNTPNSFSKLSYAEKSRVDELDTAIATLVNLPSAQPDLSEYSDKLWRNAYERGKRDALEESQWIPCSDRLPEDSDYHDLWETPDGAVLWCKATGEIGVGWYYESTKNWCDLWDNGVKDVIAWMPLPDPYEGE